MAPMRDLMTGACVVDVCDIASFSPRFFCRLVGTESLTPADY
jgi:hypothetical protein